MRMTRTPLLPASAMLLLASCTSHPRIEIGEKGAVPQPAAYILAGDMNDAPSSLAARLADQLGGEGFTKASAPRYLVQIVDAALPGGAGLFLPDAQPDQSGHAPWLESPTNSRSKHKRRLTISFTDIATGREVYRAYGIEHYRKQQRDDGDPLVDAVLSQLAQ